MIERGIERIKLETLRHLMHFTPYELSVSKYLYSCLIYHSKVGPIPFLSEDGSAATVYNKKILVFLLTKQVVKGKVGHLRYLSERITNLL